MRHHACARGGRSIASLFVAVAVVTGLTIVSARAGYGLTSGPLSPTTVVDDASFGGASWFPPGNAMASDNTYATTAPGGSPTHYLKATNFGFSIPSPAQILGIQVFVERKSSLGTIFDSRSSHYRDLLDNQADVILRRDAHGRSNVDGDGNPHGDGHAH